MNKKYIIAGITCGFVLLTGVCYSYTYHKQNNSSVVETNLSKDDKDNELSHTVPGDKVLVDTQNDRSLPTEITEGITEPKDGTRLNTKQEEKSSSVSFLYVHLCGAVKSPGVYKAEVGARLIDLIVLAGGLTKEAAGDYINQAETVTDGQRIYIPTLTETQALTTKEFMSGVTTSSQSAGSDKQAKDAQLLNINTATAEQLMELPGIGQSKADSIIEYRNTQGEFTTIDDLMNIPGIKEGVFHRISTYISVN